MQVILINDQFPGPPIEAVTNNNIVVNVINHLDEPFLITWFVELQPQTFSFISYAFALDYMKMKIYKHMSLLS